MPFSQLAPLRRDSSSISDHTLGPTFIDVGRQLSAIFHEPISSGFAAIMFTLDSTIIIK